MRKTILALCYLVGSVLVCTADQPVCVGNRHYDGVACCYSEETTTTTLPENDGCPTVVCPEIPACPTVNCGDGSTTTYNVVVNRCPSYPAPAYYKPCKKTKHHGIVCPAPGHPHRVFMPSSRP